jgi:DNA mismatch endonuclease (patch repair protein)
VTDVFSKRKRSKIMSRIRSSGTKPEVAFRKLVRELSGRRLRLNVPSLPGSPDVVVYSLRLALFIDGCFWHCCPLHGSKPKSNVAFWKDKLRKNVLRDRRTRRELRCLGWTVWVLWEHDLRPRAVVRTRRNLRKRFARLVARL